MLRAPLLTLARRSHPRRADRAAGAHIDARSLVFTFTAYLMAVCAFWTLVCARGWQAPRAGNLRVALDIEWRASLTGETHLGLFALLCVLMVWTWGAASRAISRSGMGIGVVVLGAALLGLPMMLLTSIYSDDVYLYHFYGRELAHYGANPFITPPAAFDGDPLLKWVYWKWLPAAYGPLWLLISAPLSALAGDSVTAAVVVYRGAGLAAHLAAASIIHATVRSWRPERAVAAAAFYAWNPLVLFESVASAHNDAVVVLFLGALVWAFVRERPALCGALLGCAVMVKPFAVIAAVPLTAAMWGGRSGWTGVQRVAVAAVAGAMTVAALYLPFNAGPALLWNASSNPAAGTYMNSVWELIAVHFGGWAGPARTWIENTWLDPLRATLLVTAGVVGAMVSLRTRRIAPGTIVLWMGFCLSQAWIWPWYFLPIIAMACFAGAPAQRLATALSLGGLLFYVAWPPPTKELAWIYTSRPLLLFGPAGMMLVIEGLSLRRWGRLRLVRAYRRRPRNTRTDELQDARTSLAR